MTHRRRSFLQQSTLLAAGLATTAGSVAATDTRESGSDADSVDGTVTHFGQPIADAAVELDDGESTMTDEDGAFSLDRTPDSQTVSVSAPGYADQTVPIETEAGATTLSISLDEVWGPDTGELDVIATPIGGGDGIPCTITLFGEETKTVSAPLGAIPDGQYWNRYLTVPEGWWEVRISDAEGYSDGYKRVYVEAGETEMAWVELGETETEIPDTGRLLGQVVDERGRSIADAVVTIGEETVSTDAEGRFELDLAHGRHETAASAPGYAERTGSTLVKFGRTTTLTIALDAV